MKKVICVIMVLLMAFVVSSCGSNKASNETGVSKEKDKISNENSYAETDESKQKDTLSNENSDAENADDPDEVIRKVFENMTNPEEYSNILYGDYDYAKAINLYYKCLNEVYEYNIVDEVDKAIVDRYNTSDYRKAFEIYYKDTHQSASEEQFFENSQKKTPTYEETKEYIDNYNANIPTMSYASLKTYEEMGGEYGEYMAVAMNSVKINMDDIDEMVMYEFPEANNTEFLCVKIDGQWYPVLPPFVVSFEHFASYLCS